MEVEQIEEMPPIDRKIISLNNGMTKIVISRNSNGSELVEVYEMIKVWTNEMKEEL